jgi:hypothetical protein
MAFGRKSKGGSSAARAARAKKGHAKRRAKLFDSSHYKGGRRRAKRTWLT